MSMKKLKQAVDYLTDLELRMANHNYPAFRSAHEGHSVIQEEMEEFDENAEHMQNAFALLWRNIRQNALADDTIDILEMSAIDAACEAIQVAAMCRKYRDMESKYVLEQES